MATDELTTDRPTSSTEWDEAFDNYQGEQAAYASVAAKYEAACAAYYEEVPNRGEEFANYGLRFRDDRDRTRLIRNTAVAVGLRDFAGRDNLSAEAFAAIAERAAHIVDDYLVWRRLDNEAFERLVEGDEKKHDEACDKLYEARERLLNTPAPDVKAMVFKLDVLASIMAEHDAEDAPHVASIRDDAHRLLGRA